MGKQIAVVICNYNKKEYVLKNIESLLKQDMDSFDIYVVDNASTDGSAEEIRKVYGDCVTMICNEENLGGTGGFNTGIRFVLDKGYSFVVLLDNDVTLREDALSTLYKDMEDNPDIGIMGAKILKMDHPHIIQEFAPTVNYATMTFELHHGGETDDGSLPHYVDCDYVPACALMIRTEVINKIGCMPEENYIYYDDIEWGIRCIRAGYRVVANSRAAVWHKGGALNNPTTFGTYYLNRNKLKYFMTYSQTMKPVKMDPVMREERIDHILRDIFEGIYSCEYAGNTNVAKTRMDAFADSLCGVTGIADEYKIRKREETDLRFIKMLEQISSIRIYMEGLWESTRRIIERIYQIEKRIGHKYDVELIDDLNHGSDNCLGITIKSSGEKSDSEFDMVFHVCRHIYELEIESLDRKWIDGWQNMIIDEDDYHRYLEFDPSYKRFKLCFEDRVRERMKELKGDFILSF